MQNIVSVLASFLWCLVLGAWCRSGAWCTLGMVNRRRTALVYLSGLLPSSLPSTVWIAPLLLKVSPRARHVSGTAILACPLQARVFVRTCAKLPASYPHGCDHVHVCRQCHLTLTLCACVCVFFLCVCVITHRVLLTVTPPRPPLRCPPPPQPTHTQTHRRTWPASPPRSAVQTPHP